MRYTETKRWVNSAGIDVSEGVLTIGDIEFKAISGGGGKGPLPAGEYVVHRPVDVGPENKNRDAYSLEGFSFFAAISPLFESDRTYLGIHPDGNKPGTMGCIGVKEKIAQLYRLLCEIPVNGQLPLTVEMKGGK